MKYVPESMRIPSSNLKLQDAVGQGITILVYLIIRNIIIIVSDSWSCFIQSEICKMQVGQGNK